MGAIEGLSKFIAWIIVTSIKIMVYPVYIISSVVANLTKGILDMVSSKKSGIDLMEE